MLPKHPPLLALLPSNAGEDFQYHEIENSKHYRHDLQAQEQKGNNLSKP